MYPRILGSGQYLTLSFLHTPIVFKSDEPGSFFMIYHEWTLQTNCDNWDNVGRVLLFFHSYYLYFSKVSTQIDVELVSMVVASLEFFARSHHD